MYNVYNLLIFSNDDLLDVNACPTQLVVPCALYFAKYLLCSCDHYKLFVCFARSSSIRVWGASSLYDTRIFKSPLQLPICKVFSSLCIWIRFVIQTSREIMWGLWWHLWWMVYRHFTRTVVEVESNLQTLFVKHLDHHQVRRRHPWGEGGLGNNEGSSALPPSWEFGEIPQPYISTPAVCWIFSR